MKIGGLMGVVKHTEHCAESPMLAAGLFPFEDLEEGIAEPAEEASEATEERFLTRSAF